MKKIIDRIKVNEEKLYIIFTNQKTYLTIAVNLSKS